MYRLSRPERAEPVQRVRLVPVRADRRMNERAAGVLLDRRQVRPDNAAGVEPTIEGRQRAGHTLACGSLFSGVGGIDLGLERAGMRVLWQVEYDKYCQSVLRHRFPGTEIYGDVREVGWANSEHTRESRPAVQQCAESAEPDTGRRDRDAGTGTVRAALAPVDLICGGFPCQDVSVAGNRAGLAGDRSGLWHEFHRIIGEVMPRWVLIENVPGLLSSNGGADLAIVLSGLADLGYGWSYRILDSQYFGVAQRRRRVFIVGYLGDAGSAFRALHPVGTGIGRNPAPSRETREGTAVSTQVSIDGSGIDWRLPVKCADEFQLCECCEEPWCDECGAHYADCRHPGPHSEPPEPICASSGQSNAEICVGVSPTLNLNRDGAPIKFDQSVPRRLTPRECERLQGFPDDWTLVEHNGKPMSDGQRYKQMGNAVTVNVAEWIGRRILADE